MIWMSNAADISFESRFEKCFCHYLCLQILFAATIGWLLAFGRMWSEVVCDVLVDKRVDVGDRPVVHGHRNERNVRSVDQLSQRL